MMYDVCDGFARVFTCAWKRPVGRPAAGASAWCGTTGATSTSGSRPFRVAARDGCKDGGMAGGSGASLVGM